MFCHESFIEIPYFTRFLSEQKVVTTKFQYFENSVHIHSENKNISIRRNLLCFKLNPDFMDSHNPKQVIGNSPSEDQKIRALTMIYKVVKMLSTKRLSADKKGFRDVRLTLLLT